MGITVALSAPEHFDALAFGAPPPSTIQYLESQFTNIVQTVGDYGSQFVDRVKGFFNQYNSGEAIRKTRAALAMAEGMHRKDIHYIGHLDGLQQAPVEMQRWIMANPTVRERYHLQRCNGYSDSYVDMEPDAIGENHYDYRKVMHGVVQMLPKDESGETGWCVKWYLDEEKEGDRDLSFVERNDILNTWDNAAAIMIEGEDDPTSPYGGSL